jgi:hypothetical protein
VAALIDPFWPVPQCGDPEHELVTGVFPGWVAMPWRSSFLSLTILRP